MSETMQQVETKPTLSPEDRLAEILKIAQDALGNLSTRSLIGQEEATDPYIDIMQLAKEPKADEAASNDGQTLSEYEAELSQ